ncbi:TonB-dependent receptor plug domain-containing protein [Sporomusa acidovorans]|uniref:Ferrienterobactin receptor n=1 Tax=Sporomusa acidovorans (strain ATCC 49682 / DSM 3132 / Mol) TaxID=1123286 RepID=A0ABZ3J6A5_SPOA4|nr:TonB-dependent receptor [Sporomusa acidovorans]OZC15406.1 ferrienterobactin receptor precursor [Sporomusa acidovorans DSM 3132]SDF13234.1 TonB-dependent siderophore receptor [Sporomusa acidovorans]
MNKDIRCKVAIVNCLLLMLPGLACAADGNAKTNETTTVDEVVVSAVPLEKYLVTTSVITAKDIEAKGARNLTEVLEDVPGLNLHSGRKGNTAIDIRGLSSSEVKIYIDGVLINPLAKMTSSAAMDTSMIPVNNIAKIEIIKGPAPVIYGSDAKGGVILITTKSGNTNQGGNLSLATGTWGTWNGSVSYGGGNKKFNYYFDAASERTDGYRNYEKDTRYFNTKLKWTFGNDSSLTFAGGYSTTDKDCPNAIDPATGKRISYKTGFWPGLNDWQYRDWEKTNLSLDYVKKVNKKLDFDIKVYRFDEKQGIWANGATYDSSTGVNATKSGYSKDRWNASYWDSDLTGVEMSSNWKLNNMHTLTFGMLYNTIDWSNSDSALSDPDNYSWLDYNNKRYGYYMQDNILANDRTTVTIGIRHDRNEVEGEGTGKSDDSDTNPTINMVYRLDDRNTLRTSYGQTYNFPSAEQLFGTTSGNPNLKAEKAKNYELGLKHVFDSTLTGDIALFQNDIKDKINRLSKKTKYNNMNWAKIKGVELELNKEFSDKVNGFLNYTYLDTKGENVDGTVTELTYTPKHHINYGVNYQAGKGYSLNLTGHLVGRRYTGDTGKDDTRSVQTVYSHLASYNLVDLKISRKVSEKQDWYVTVYNIFDKDYEDELFYPSPGISMMVGTNYKF